MITIVWLKRLIVEGTSIHRSPMERTYEMKQI